MYFSLGVNLLDISIAILYYLTKCVRLYGLLKVTRAEALLRNLEEERERWSLSSESFTNQLQSLIGDAILGASFITYLGVFDYRTRKVRFPSRHWFIFVENAACRRFERDAIINW